MVKNNSLILVSVFAGGVAVGWFSRSEAGNGTGDDKTGSLAAVASNASRSENEESENAPVAGKRAIREVAPKKTDGPLAQMIQPGSEAMKDMQDKVGKMMADQKRVKLQQHIDKLAVSLGLTAAQKAGLQTWLDQRIAKMESMSIEDMGKSGKDGDLMKSLTNQAFEEQLAATLTEEQKTALANFKTRDTQSRIDSAALKSLSQLQGVIEFEDGQRDAVYKILSDAAATKIETESEGPASSSISLNGMGIDLDPYDLGIKDLMKDAATKAGSSAAPPDRKQISEIFRSLVDQRIEAKVDEMRPVFNESQLDQYRTELKNKGSGVLGGAMIRLGNGSGGATSIVIPAN